MASNNQHFIAFDGLLWRLGIVVNQVGASTLSCSRREFHGKSENDASSATDELNEHNIAHSKLDLLCCDTVADVNGMKELLVLSADMASKTNIVYLSSVKLSSMSKRHVISTRKLVIPSSRQYAETGKHRQDVLRKHVVVVESPETSNEIKCENLHGRSDSKCIYATYETSAHRKRDAFLTNGSNFALVIDNALLFTSVNSSHLREFHIISLVSRGSQDHITFTVIHLAMVNRQFVMLIKLSFGDNGDDNFLRVCSLDCDTNVHSLQEPQSIVPSMYASSLTCLHVMNIEILPSNSNIKKPTNHCLVTSEVLLCTDQSQLVYLQDGKWMDSAWLPFNTANSVLCFEVSDCSRLIAVLSENNSCCIVDRTNFQINTCIEHVGSMFVDDFMQNGAEQLLMLSASNSDNFILTDLNGVHLDKVNPTPSSIGSVEDSEGVSAAVKALETRLQSGQDRVREMRQRITRESLLLRAACKDVQNMSSQSTDSNCDKRGLLPFIGPGIDFSPGLMDDSKTVGVQLSDIWRQVVDGKLVLGISVFNGTTRWMRQPILSPAGGAPIAASSKCLKYSLVKAQNVSLPKSLKTSKGTLQPAQKKRKFSAMDASDVKTTTGFHKLKLQEVDFLEPGFSATLCVGMDLPVVGECQDSAVELVLKWTDGEEETDAESRVMRKWSMASRADGPLYMKACGAVDVIFDVIMKQPSVVEMSETDDVNMLLAFLVPRRTIHLQVTSSLSDPEQEMKHALAGVGGVWQPLLTCYIVHLTNCNRWVGVHLGTREGNALPINCYYLDEGHLSTFIHLLYDTLSDDVMIIPSTNDCGEESDDVMMKQSAGHNVIQPCIRAMENEISHMQESIKYLFESVQIEDKTEESVGESLVVTAKRDFDRVRKVIHGQSESCCSVDDFCNVVQENTILQKQTDAALAAVLNFS